MSQDRPRYIYPPAPEEATAIGAFFANDLGRLNIFRVVDQQGSTLTRGEVLGLMETLRGQHTEGAQIFPLVSGEEAVSIIFDDGDAMPVGDLHDRVHFTGHTGIVDHHDGARARRDQSLQPGFVEVERIRPNVGKDRFGIPQDKGIDRGNERERWDDHFIPGLQIQQQRGHFQRVRAGRR